jgi:hypothetical protein
MGKTLGMDPKNFMFGIISDVTPTSFLYSIDPKNLSEWKYIGPLANFGLNLRPSRWSGDLGKNWEVTNFLSLNDENDPRSQARRVHPVASFGCLATFAKTRLLALLVFHMSLEVTLIMAACMLQTLSLIREARNRLSGVGSQRKTCAMSSAISKVGVEQRNVQNIKQLKFDQIL